jgi:hypothetical protein
MHNAITEGHLHVLKRFKSRFYFTMRRRHIITAAQYGSLDIVKWMYEWVPYLFDDSIVREALRLDDTEMLRWILEETKLASHEHNLMKMCIRYGHVKDLNVIFEYIPRPETDVLCNTAAERGHLDTLK